MTEEQAKEWLVLKTAAGTEPELTQWTNGDIDTLLDMAVTTSPSSEGASDGVWSLNRAAAEGCRVKAMRYMERVDHSADNASFSMSQIPDRLMKMAKDFDAVADRVGEPPLGGVSSDDMELFEIEVGVAEAI